MPRNIADYVALALIEDVQSESYFSRHSADFSGDLEQLKAHAESRCGFVVPDDVLKRVIRTLADCSLIRITEDSYAGTFVKIKSSQFKDFIGKARAQLQDASENDGGLQSVAMKPSDYPQAYAIINHELFDDYDELGSSWLKRALDGLKVQVEAEGFNEKNENVLLNADFELAPASDRIVTLQDNQRVELEEASTELISAVEKENAIDGDASLRERFIGQIKAGRELIRAKTLKSYLLYSTVMTMLGQLIDRYKEHAIGHAAKKLFDLLAEHIFGK